MKLILLVEDNPMIPKFIGKRYEKQYAVEWVRNVSDAKYYLDSSLPDLVITDLHMPGENGYHLINYIRDKEFAKEIPILVLSGQTSAEDRVKAYEAGADFYLTKPFHPKELDLIISKITSDIAA